MGLSDFVGKMADLVIPAGLRRNDQKTRPAVSAGVAAQARRRKLKPTVLKYRSPFHHHGTFQTLGRGDFEDPEYDLAEITRAEDVEPYVALSFMRHRIAALKNGWVLQGRNLKTLAYIRRRMAEIAWVTDITSQEIIRQLMADLIRYSNAFLYLRRNSDISSGNSIRKFGRNLQAIAGIFVIDAATMRAKKDKRGNVVRWEQFVDTNEEVTKRYLPEDIIHISYNRKNAFTFGTPYAIPSLDDIRALRRLEEMVEMLISKHLFPLFQYKVGSEDEPADLLEDGTSELAQIEARVADMPTEGCIVTSERHEIVAINTDGGVDANPALEYFRARVLAGLNLSKLDVGEGDCYDELTETLTEDGWKFYHEIDHSSDRIATFNPDTGELEYHVPNYQYVGDYQGSMLHFKSPKHVDMVVTPHHEMWVSFNRGVRWQKVKARDLLDARVEEFYVRDAVFGSRSVQWGDAESLVSIPWCDYLGGYTSRNKTGDDVKVDSTILAELIGWFVTDGHLVKANGKYNVQVSQRKLAGVQQLRDLWERLPFDGNIRGPDKRGDYTFEINHKGLHTWLGENCGSDNECKRLPRELILSSPNVLSAALQAMVAGDGSIDIRPGRTNFVVYTVSKHLRDDVQELAFRLGYSAKWIETDQSEGAHGDGSIYRVLISAGRTHRYFRTEDISAKPYDGKIYCFNVPNHLFVTRRNGKIAIQGNTANRGTAIALSKALIDRAKDFQCVLSEEISAKLYNTFLLEGGFDLTEDDFVYLTFQEIDLEALMAIDNHFMALYQGNMITEDEARIGMKREVLSDEQRDRLHLNLVQIPLEQAKIEAQIPLVEAQAETAAAAKPAEGGNKTTSSTNRTTQRNQPTNQFGRRASAAVGTRKNDVNGNGAVEDKLTVAEFSPDGRTENFIKYLDPFWDDFRDGAAEQLAPKMGKGVVPDTKALATSFLTLRDTMVEGMRKFLVGAGNDGRVEAIRDMKAVDITASRSSISLEEFEPLLENFLDRLFTDTLFKLRKRMTEGVQAEDEDADNVIRSTFEALRYRLHFMARTELAVARNLGYASAAGNSGLTQVFWEPKDQAKVGETQQRSIDIRSVHIALLRPPHPNATDRVSIFEDPAKSKMPDQFVLLGAGRF